jgi:TPR repeat protein
MTATLGCMNGSISRGLVLCTVLVSLMASLVLAATPAYADGVETIASKQNQTENNACPYFIKTVMDTDWFSDRYTKRLEGIRASVALLVLDCPTTPVDMPVKALHEYQNISQDDSVSFMLGAAYEYGLHVQIDLDEARYWYKRFAFMTSGFSDEEIDNVRQRLFTFNPLVKKTHDEKLDAAVAEGKFTSPLFEAEVAAVRKLLSGPISGIIDASDHLYRGTGGYPQSKQASRTLLDIAAKRGAPEADFAIAIALFDHRYYYRPATRQDQLLEVQSHLRRAAAKRFVPAILELAKFCEVHEKVTGLASAMALYQFAEREGAQDIEKHLRRLQSKWTTLFDWWYEKLTEEIKAGKMPLCF